MRGYTQTQIQIFAALPVLFVVWAGYLLICLLIAGGPDCSGMEDWWRAFWSMPRRGHRLSSDPRVILLSLAAGPGLIAFLILSIQRHSPSPSDLVVFVILAIPTAVNAVLLYGVLTACGI